MPYLISQALTMASPKQANQGIPIPNMRSMGAIKPGMLSMRVRKMISSSAL